jgi:hypothetical protein
MPAALLAAITHHNALEARSARMEGRPPVSPQAGVAELRPTFLAYVESAGLTGCETSIGSCDSVS